MNLNDLQNHINDKKRAGKMFSVMRSHLESTEVTEHAGISIYNYDINNAIEYFRDLAISKKAKTDKQFNSYFEIQDILKQMRKKGIE